MTSNTLFYPDIAPADIEAIVAQFDVSLYLTQEVIWGSGQPVTPELYTGIGLIFKSLAVYHRPHLSCYHAGNVQE